MKDVNSSLEEDWSGKPGGKNAVIVYWLSLVLLALAIAIPRRLALNRPVTPDEHLWLTRSANFYMALSQGDLVGTYQSEHPGVTAMWAGAASFVARFPQYRESGLGQVDSNQFNRFIRNVKGVTPLELLVAARLFMLLGHTVILLAGYEYARRLLGIFPALISFLLIAFEPYHVALTRLLHLDGMVSNLLLLSLLAFFNYIARRFLIDLVVSAIAAGLGVLTKLPAVLIAPTVGLLIVYACWKETGGSLGASPSRLIPPAARIAAAWSLVAMLTFVALWPAMWVKPVQTISTMLTQGAGHFDTDPGALPLTGSRGMPSNDLSINTWYFYPISYLFRTTPVVLVGLALAGWAFLTKRALYPQTTRLVVAGSLVYIGIFMGTLSAGDIKIDRYMLPVYLPLDIIAGLGWSSLILSSFKKLSPGLRGYTPYPLVVVLTVVQFMFTMNATPYYLSYYNPLLGGIQQAQKVLPIGWGEGLDQAAQYLNKKPGAGKLEAVTYFASGCFSYYFEGRVREILSSDLTEDDWQKFLESDYAIIYITQRQRQIALPILDYVSRLEPEKSIWINGLEYARIYKLR